MAKPMKKTNEEQVTERKQKRAKVALVSGLQKKARLPGVSEEEIVKSKKVYSDPGQWLGNKHPITRM